MLLPKTRWSVKKRDPQKAQMLVEELKITPLVATLLVNRGFDTIESARSFLNPGKSFHDPFLLTDMDILVNRVQEAIKKNEKIVVYGDYDADGVSSTYIMVKTLHQLGAQVGFYIPNRFTEGYGPNENAFRHLKEEGFSLIITVDNGISGLHEARVAKEIGIDLIITDHHEPGPELPEALAVIHPKRFDSEYPFKELAGVGVALKVATALLGEVPTEMLPYAAIGTVADLVPLHDENRVIVKEGLKVLRTTKDPGLVALMKQAGVNQTECDEDTIGFMLAPRINAPGRLDDATPAVELFLADDWYEAEELAEIVGEMNRERQEIVNQMAEEAIAMVAATQEEHNDSFIAVGKEGWHAGVIGIVASRLVEHFYRPTIVFTYDRQSGLAKGSARSIPGFNMYENLSKCRDILPHFGGHPMAAGMTLKLEDVGELRRRMNQLASEQLTDEDFIPSSEIDGTFTLEEASLDAAEQIQALAPFGNGNPRPKILLENVYLRDLRKVGADEKHLKATIIDGEERLDAIAWDMGPYSDHISPLARVSIIGELGINEWNNVRKPQFYLKDVAIREWQLFDLRGNRKLTYWLDKIPKENRIFILFHKEIFENEEFRFIQDEAVLIDSVPTAKGVDIDGKNVIFVDIPPNRELMEMLIQGKKPARIYTYFYQKNGQFFQLIPTREHFKWYYAFLMKKGVVDIRRYAADIARYRGWTVNTIHFMTKVFFELEFVTINNGIITVTKGVKKRDLAESETYRKTQERISLERELLYSSYQELKTWFENKLGSQIEEEKVLWI